MAIITKITVQKKNASRYNIFLDERYGFSVEEDLLISHQLHKGMVLDQSTIQQLKEQDTIHKSYQLALRYLSYRMRAKQEIKDYLIRKEVDENHLSPVLTKLETKGLVDDLAFARSYIRTKMNTGMKGPLLLKNELYQKGISANLIEESLKEYPIELQVENARKWAEKSIRTSQKRSFQMEVNRIKAGLMRKGYNMAVIQQAIDNLPHAKDTTEEWEALLYQGEKLWKKQQKKHEGFMLKNKVKEGLYRKGFALDAIQRFIDEYAEKE